MPVTKSAAKALRKDRRKNQLNKPILSRFRSAVKKAIQEPSKENLQQASSALDRAAKRRVIHKNKAARLKSRLAKLLHKKST